MFQKNFIRKYGEAFVTGKKLGIKDIDDVMDIKVGQKYKDIVSVMGTPKMKPYTIGKYKFMPFTEQVQRWSDIGYGLVKPQEVKQIPKAVAGYKELAKIKGITPKGARALMEFEKAGLFLEAKPIEMDPFLKKTFYAGSVKEWAFKKIGKWSTKAFPKYYERKFVKLRTKVRPLGGATVSYKVKVPSFVGKGISSAFIVPSVKFRIQPSKSSSFISSSSISKSSSSVSKSISKSISSISKSISKSSSSISSSMSSSASSSSTSSSSSSSSSSSAFITMPFPILPPVVTKEKKQKPITGYQVYLKGHRQYKKAGKPLKTRQQALGFGAFKTDTTVTRYFTIKPSKQPAINMPKWEMEWPARQHKFTQKGNVFEELPMFAYDMPGEKKRKAPEPGFKPIWIGWKEPKSKHIKKGKEFIYMKHKEAFI